MVFTIDKASSWSMGEKMEFATLDDLWDWMKRYEGCKRFVIDVADNEITVYDDYLE